MITEYLSLPLGDIFISTLYLNGHMWLTNKKPNPEEDNVEKKNIHLGLHYQAVTVHFRRRKKKNRKNVGGKGENFKKYTPVEVVFYCILYALQHFSITHLYLLTYGSDSSSFWVLFAISTSVA